MSPFTLPFAWLGSSLLGMLHRSWGVRTEGLERLDNLLDQGKRVMVIFWHGQYLPLFPLLQGRCACVFASQSRRGEIVCAISRRFGHNCIMLGDHVEHDSLAVMRQALAQYALTGLAPDGPLGPYRQVKSGIIRLSSEFGLTLLPVVAVGRPRLVLKNRWDRMEIPLPFALIGLTFGDPMNVPRDFGSLSVGQWSDRVRESLEDTEAKSLALLD